MPEAWIVRGKERTELIGEIMGLIYEKAEEDEDIFFEIVEVAERYLRKKYSNTCKISTEKIFFQEVLPLVQRFARAQEEERFIIAEISKKALEKGLMPCYSFLSKLEIEKPEIIFNAPSAMSEISLKEKEVKNDTAVGDGRR